MSPSPWQVLDIQMKRMNGDVACRQLREAGIRLPIIAATGEEAHKYTTAHISLHAR
jgi:CheY-like chemotaxis protein